MKPLKDLILCRKELQDWEDNLVWGRDGTLYLSCYPDLCVAQPMYSKEVDSNSKYLFHVKDYPLNYENKFEFDSAGTNALLNSQPLSYGRIVKPSPVNNILAVLTSNLNVILFKEQERVVNLDAEGKKLEERSYHSVEWAPNGVYIAVGNENQGITIFEVDSDDDGNISTSIKTYIDLDRSSHKRWVTKICWKDDTIVASLDDNSIFMIKCDENYVVHEVKPASRFKVIDISFFKSFILITDACNLHRIDLVSGARSTLPLGIGDAFYIVPLSDASSSVLLVSSKTSCKIMIGKELVLTPDDIISPILERKFKRWSSLSNEFSNYETTMLLQGISLSPDGYSVALIYSMNRVSLKYKIASECQYNIAFIPLFDSWRISRKATGLAWYQTYQIYKCALPSMEKNSDSEEKDMNLYHVGLSFKQYIKAFVNDSKMNDLRFFNFIEATPSIALFRRAIFEFAVANSLKITHPLDKASVQSLAALLEIDSPVTAGVVEVKSEFITEMFDFQRNVSADFIISEEGHTWKRCAVTLLPILTTMVKICPISGQRTIDIKRDKLNNYGWFTRTLLEVLNGESIYSGTPMTAA